MDNPVRWAAVIFLAALFVIFAAYNGISAWERIVRQRPCWSWAPIFGGLFGVMAVLAFPVGALTERLSYAWLPLLLDISIPATAIGLWLEFGRRK